MAWDKYALSHPGAADVLLIVEVSDSTLRSDRGTKLPLYAQHGIPEVWIVDVQGRTLHVYRSPADGRYTEMVSLTEQDRVSPALLPAVAIDLAQLLVAGRSAGP